LTTVRWPIAAWFLWLLLVAGSAGCDAWPFVVCFVDGDQSVQLSPSGRAVAFVDADAYDRIASATDHERPLLDCNVREFTTRFSARPEAIIFTLNFEDDSVTMARLMHDRGFSFPEDLRADLPQDRRLQFFTALHEVLEFMDTVRAPPRIAFNTTFRYEEEGIGSRSVVDDIRSSSFPDNKRGYLFLPTKEDLVVGRFNHEFAHFWGIDLRGPAALRAQLARFPGHWGFSSVGGMLGGWSPDSLVSVGDDMYHARAFPAGRALNQTEYAPLELYLMGLAPPHEVAPIQVAINSQQIGKTGDALDIFRAERLETITIEEIIAANGERQPSYQDASKTFNLALIILTDHRLSDNEWRFYERAIDFLQADENAKPLDFFAKEEFPGQHEFWASLLSSGPLLNFCAATRGRGALHFVNLQSPP